jgi:penicillin amidase
MQQDTVSLLYRDLRPVLAALILASPAATEWRERLLAWDGDLTAGSREAAVFEAWYIALTHLPAAETGREHWHHYPRFLVHALTQGDPACAEHAGGCAGFAATALEEALKRLGPDPLPWGKLHQALFPHAVLTHTPLAFLSDRHLPHDGDRDTLNVGWYRPEDFGMYHGPTYRQIIDWSDPEASLFVLAGGQSGHWLTPGYDDLLPLWETGRYLPMRMKDYPVAWRLRLEPAPR